MYNYAIGLDIGIASVGWAIVALDANENPCGIINMGSRIFDAAEHPKNGASLAAPRREARSARRRLRRHRHRNERIRALLVNEGVISVEALASLFSGKLEDIYALRVRALDETIDGCELSRILVHLAQRRGFRSNRKSGAGEDGVLLTAVNENKERMKKEGYRTVGEMLLRDKVYADHKRNKGGDYLATVTRDAIEEETRTIFAAQRALGNALATDELEEAYIQILLSQRSFDEGPGFGPYSGSQIEKMVRFCTFEAGEKRAAKATYSFEYFTLLEKLNHIRLIENGQSRPLTAEQRDRLINLAHKSADLNYLKLRKELGIEDTARFNIVRYPKDVETAEAEKKEKFAHLRQYHKIRKAMGGAFSSLSTDQIDLIATALSYYKTSEKIRAYLSDGNFSEEELTLIDNIGNFSGFGHLSVTACKKLIPHLEQGLNYNEACAAAGYDFKAHGGQERDILLHPQEGDFTDITSPVARRAIAQTIKVVNAIIRKQGCSPIFVNIEVARELAKNFTERKQLEKDMLSNQAENERLMEELRTTYKILHPTGQDLVKLKLWKQQDGVCAYSLKQISAEKLFAPNYTEVDHIIPYSISFDDSYKNKVLVLTEENRDKGNRLPLQYLTGEKRDQFVVWTNNHVKDYKKRQLLLKESITEEDHEKFKERNLQDTKTASRFLLNYLNDHLLFAPSEKRKKRVTAVNGAVTSHMRKRWGLQKIRADGDLHHALDALVIACTTDGLIRQVSKYAQWRECRYMPGEESSFAVDEQTGEVLKEFPYPWSQFRQEVDARMGSNPTQAVLDRKLPFYYLSGEPIDLKPIFVSRVPRRKVTGAAHKDTVRSAVMLEEGCTVSKQSLTALKLDKDGEIDGYYKPESDKLLYEALKARLKQFGGDGKKAFADGKFYKPKSDGTPGHEVKKVKIYEKSTLNVNVHGGQGVAAHDSMVRIDVFHVENDGYYFVPIYVADTLKPELPNLACVAGKPYIQWKPMRDEDFIFSLYPNDLIKVTHRTSMKLAVCQKGSSLAVTKEVHSEYFYYTGADISTCSIIGITHDNTYKARGLGIKNLVEFEKYTVEVLGEYHPIKKEVRQPFVRK